MNRLSASQINKINCKIIGTEDNFNDKEEKFKNILKDIAFAPYEQDEKFFYRYRDTVSKAAKLSYDIADQKPFGKGNIKTAVFIALTLLQINQINTKEGYQEDLPIFEAALRDGDFKQIEDWLRNHTRDRFAMVIDEPDFQGDLCII